MFEIFSTLPSTKTIIIEFRVENCGRVLRFHAKNDEIHRRIAAFDWVTQIKVGRPKKNQQKHEVCVVVHKFTRIVIWVVFKVALLRWKIGSLEMI